jgi:acyl-CoA synthetase (NDP forming)
MQQTLQIAREIREEHPRAQALASVAPYLPEPLLREAGKAAQAVSDEWARIQILAACAIRLPETERTKILDEALQAARGRRMPRR